MKSPLYVVGLGPGEKDLLTLKAASLIRNAETLILSRHLLAPFLLSMNRKAVRWNLEVNPSRVRAAIDKGLRLVVALEGDPLSHQSDKKLFSFLKEVGVSFEFVPGIHPALAASVKAGIVPTHREYASSFAVGYPGAKKLNADTLFRQTKTGWKIQSRKKTVSLPKGTRHVSRLPNQL